MGGKRGVAVLLVGVLVVSVSGFATGPGGVGGPTMDASGGDGGLASGSFADAGAVDAADRLDGPEEEVREYLRSQAVDVTAGDGAEPGYDPASGVGLPVLP